MIERKPLDSARQGGRRRPKRRRGRQQRLNDQLIILSVYVLFGRNGDHPLRIDAVGHPDLVGQPGNQREAVGRVNAARRVIDDGDDNGVFKAENILDRVPIDARRIVGRKEGVDRRILDQMRQLKAEENGEPCRYNQHGPPPRQYGAENGGRPSMTVVTHQHLPLARNREKNGRILKAASSRHA